MKSLTKFLTAISPIAVVGTIVPTLSACGGNTFVINYGDVVNCKDKKAENYHKISTIQSAVRVKAAKMDRGAINLDTINTFVQTTDEGLQMFYFDIIASYVLLNNEAIYLSAWSVNAEKHISFTLDGSQQYESDQSSIEYSFNPDGKAVWTIGNLTRVSYTLSDCWERKN